MQMKKQYSKDARRSVTKQLQAITEVAGNQEGLKCPSLKILYFLIWNYRLLK